MCMEMNFLRKVRNKRLRCLGSIWSFWIRYSIKICSIYPENSLIHSHNINIFLKIFIRKKKERKKNYIMKIPTTDIPHYVSTMYNSHIWMYESHIHIIAISTCNIFWIRIFSFFLSLSLPLHVSLLWKQE